VAVLSDVLVVNAGSTSLKLSLVDDDERSHPVDSLTTAPEVGAIGHRVVHGGERFSAPTLIDDAVTAELASLLDSHRCTTRRRWRQSPSRAVSRQPGRRGTAFHPRFPQSHERIPPAPIP
jgi:hypothetical protein